ncbi:hypothetical protein D9M71_537640 [compost metagenome]
MLARPRPAERNRVGAEHRLMAAGRRNPGMARGKRQGNQAGLGQLLDLDPQGRKMHTAVDRQGCDAIAPRLGLQQWQAGLERQLREPAGSVHTHDRGCLIDHFGARVGYHLAGLERADTSQHPVQAMGCATVALTGNDGVGHRLGVVSREAIVQEDRMGKRSRFGQGQSDHGHLLEQTVQPARALPCRLDRFSPLR